MSYYQIRLAAPYGEGDPDIHIKSNIEGIQGFTYRTNEHGGKSASGVFGQYMAFPGDHSNDEMEWRVPNGDGWVYFRGEIPPPTGTWQYIAVYWEVEPSQADYDMFWRWFDDDPYALDDDYHREVVEWVPPPPPVVDLEYAESVRRRTQFLMAYHNQPLEFFSAQIGPHEWFKAVVNGEQHVDEHTKENIEHYLDMLVSDTKAFIAQRQEHLTEQRREIRAEAAHIKAAEAYL